MKDRNPWAYNAYKKNKVPLIECKTLNTFRLLRVYSGNNQTRVWNHKHEVSYLFACSEELNDAAIST